MLLLNWFLINVKWGGMLKKYFYISILLGLFALSGCTDDKVDTTKTEEEAPILINLTQEQKENYYNQYLECLLLCMPMNISLSLSLYIRYIDDILAHF